MEACSLLVDLRKGMQGWSEQPLVGVEHCVTTLITAAKETTLLWVFIMKGIIYNFIVWQIHPYRVSISYVETAYHPTKSALFVIVE